jgi:dTDP-4-dehydrorhamnose 3,5-epimerase
MIFTATDVEGAYVIDPEPFVDDRGLFARVFDEDTFRELGLSTRFPQCSVSYNPVKGTMRGMHFQRGEHAEAKLIRCTRGAIYDVAIDLRPGSPTLHRWAAAELTAENHRQFYVPEGCAHGFLTLEPDSEVYYQISAAYSPEASAGVRWDDPAFGVTWPFAPVVMSPKDAAYEALRAL